MMNNVDVIIDMVITISRGSYSVLVRATPLCIISLIGGVIVEPSFLHHLGLELKMKSHILLNWAAMVLKATSTLQGLTRSSLFAVFLVVVLVLNNGI